VQSAANQSLTKFNFVNLLKHSANVTSTQRPPLDKAFSDHT
jgi:hypothetical protein